MLVHRKRRARIGVEAPLTALIDIVFLLLIYFLLTTNFMAEDGIRVQLPQATSQPPAEEEELTVVVDSDGTVFLGSRSVALNELLDALKNRLETAPETGIVVKADRTLVLDRVVQVMDVIRAAGASRLRLATERPRP
ncbi:MAG: biopolymer transporter ExbD [Thermodesulfobacteriota bacterium]|nr:biopolymer transporter ExbD [Thermodesulfobacteriota bacterium]